MINFRKILDKDEPMRSEIIDLLHSGKNLPTAGKSGISSDAVFNAMVGPVSESPSVEASILLYLRPALLIKNDRIQAPESLELRSRLQIYLPKIESRIPSVGRIDFRNMGRAFGGTGWMITEDIMVTNRHVASLFAQKKGRVLVFKENAIGDSIEVFIDFKEEYQGLNIPTNQFEVVVEKVLYIAEVGAGIPDVAFLKVNRHAKLPQAIPISDSPLFAKQSISVIGYPAYDPNGIISRIQAQDVFSDIYEVKRCSPGEVMEFPQHGWYFFHDCTTLGGNSGSVIIDNESGLAVGLHFMGEVEQKNYAVKGAEVIKHLRKIQKKFPVSDHTFKNPWPSSNGTQPILETIAEDLSDSQGYSSAFLGPDVPLPIVVRENSELIYFGEGKKKVSELKYTHFSVEMHKSRRMCFYSAVNIEGLTSLRGVKRGSWKRDPRIEKTDQIIEECYGEAPRFSRGHMTRKEDPIWGDEQTARKAAKDTFFVTNAIPQMQPFNAPVWLELENYALENARQDKMRISVFTGPIFSIEDPIKFNVRIPIEFFKIIVFIHDETKKLTATGYIISQLEHLQPEEFVYGSLKTYQVSIKTVENKAGLNFGNLSKLDPMKGHESAVMAMNKVEDARFI